MVRIRVQFDEGIESVVLLDVTEMPRIGEGLVMPKQLDPNGIRVFRVIDIAQYPVLPEYRQEFRDAESRIVQRADVRVAGTLAGGPREI